MHGLKARRVVETIGRLCLSCEEMSAMAENFEAEFQTVKQNK